MKHTAKTICAAVIAALCAAVLLTGAFGGEVFSAAGFAGDTAPNTAARAMAVVENSTDRVLYEKNSDAKLPMASTTKIATAITVIENVSNVDEIVKVPKSAVGIEGSSAYLAEGEELSIADLLHGLLLRSGNDCAVALAVTVSGSTEKFAELMNRTALKAGAKNTHFVNPHGLHHKDHYTTARDLALIASYAMKNPLFEKIVSCRKYTMPWAGRDCDRVIANKNKLLFTFEGGDGVKTGYTKNAGRCLVASAKRDGMRIICVVLDCPPMFEDCADLMERAFKEYALKKICPKGAVYRVKVGDGKESFIECEAQNALYYPLKAGEEKLIKAEPILPETVPAPIEKGREVGKIKITLDNRLIFEEKLVTIKEVDRAGYPEILRRIVEKWTK